MAFAFRNFYNNLWSLWSFTKVEIKNPNEESIFIPFDSIDYGAMDQYLDSIESPFYYKVDSISGDSIKIELKVCGRYYELIREKFKKKKFNQYLLNLL